MGHIGGTLVLQDGATLVLAAAAPAGTKITLNDGAGYQVTNGGGLDRLENMTLATDLVIDTNATLSLILRNTSKNIVWDMPTPTETANFHAVMAASPVINLGGDLRKSLALNGYGLHLADGQILYGSDEITSASTGFLSRELEVATN